MKLSEYIELLKSAAHDTWQEDPMVMFYDPYMDDFLPAEVPIQKLLELREGYRFRMAFTENKDTVRIIQIQVEC